MEIGFRNRSCADTKVRNYYRRGPRLASKQNYRNSCIKRCQASRGGGEVGSGTGSLSKAQSGPGSAGACTSGITGSTGFGLAADFADLRGGGSGLACGTGGATAIGSAARPTEGGGAPMTGRGPAVPGS